MSITKTAIGFVVAPTAVPIGIFVLFSLAYVFGLGWFADGDYSLVLGSVLTFSIYGTPIAFVVGLLGGIPVHVRLSRRGRTALLPYLGRGCILGSVPFLLFDLYFVGYELTRTAAHGISDESYGLVPVAHRMSEGVASAAGSAAMGAYCGGLGAIIFWLISVRGGVVSHDAT